MIQGQHGANIFLVTRHIEKRDFRADEGVYYGFKPYTEEPTCYA
jgi:hypothetical protein